MQYDGDTVDVLVLWLNFQARIDWSKQCNPYVQRVSPCIVFITPGWKQYVGVGGFNEG